MAYNVNSDTSNIASVTTPSEESSGFDYELDAVMN